MRRKSKVKIKSMPRFIACTVISLTLFAMIIMGMVTVSAKISTTINTQKEKSQSASNTSATSQDAETDVEEQSKIDVEDSTDADPLEAIKERLRNNDTEGIKVVFLTFDDGPSDHTGEVLDILKKYDVKGTFFTLYKEGEQAETSYRRIVNEGHTLANHTCSHNYDLYNNPQAFYADIDALDGYQRSVTGLAETSHIFRFPGGSINANETCALGIVKDGWNYADWNVSCGDGSSSPPTREVVAQNIIGGCRELDVSVVLCHAETKSETLAALPTVIETLKGEGYTFLGMEWDFTYPRQLEV